MLTEYSGASNTCTSTMSPGRIGPKPSPAPDDGPLGIAYLWERGDSEGGVFDWGKMGCSGAEFEAGLLGAGVICTGSLLFGDRPPPSRGLRRGGAAHRTSCRIPAAATTPSTSHGKGFEKWLRGATELGVVALAVAGWGNRKTGGIAKSIFPVGVEPATALTARSYPVPSHHSNRRNA